MSVRFGLAKGVLLAAAASIGLISVARSASAEEPGVPVPYAGQQQQQPDPSYIPPPPPPPPPAPLPPAQPRDAYNAGGDTREASEDPRYAAANRQPDSDPHADREPRSERCRLVEDRVFLPDGTTESSTVEACRDPRGRWHVAD